MSMLSSQIDALRRAAQNYRDFGKYEAEQMLLDAADTIWELRDDLQRANAENAKLRELVRALLTCTTDGECDECRMNGATPWHVGETQLCDGVWEHLRELGIEVD